MNAVNKHSSFLGRMPLGPVLLGPVLLGPVLLGLMLVGATTARAGMGAANPANPEVDAFSLWRTQAAHTLATRNDSESLVTAAALMVRVEEAAPEIFTADATLVPLSCH